MSRVPDPYLVTTRVITCFATDYVNLARVRGNIFS